MTNTMKAYKGLPMEGVIAIWYAKITLRDLKCHRLMATRMAKEIPAGGRVLEIAPGPGYFCIELAKLGDYQITGLDISKSFVEIARKNAAEAGINAEFRQGDAAKMPFEPESFDFVFCQAAFKNFSQPVSAIAEMYRCLRPNGVAVISDLRHDASETDINQEIQSMGLGPLNELMLRWTFQQMLLRRAYTVAEIDEMVSETPFDQARIDVNGVGFEVWLEK